jgi:hypothetical protein
MYVVSETSQNCLRQLCSGGRRPRRLRVQRIERTMMDYSARLQSLAAYYRAQADACHQMAQQASERFSQDWLDLAEKWTKLARHAEAGTFPTAHTMP